MFVTAVFGKFNVETGEVNFVNAGHKALWFSIEAKILNL